MEGFRAWKLSDALHQLTHTQSQWEIYLSVYQQSMSTPERNNMNLVAVERISEILCVKTEDEKTSLRMICDSTGMKLIRYSDQSCSRVESVADIDSFHHYSYSDSLVALSVRFQCYGKTPELGNLLQPGNWFVLPLLTHVDTSNASNDDQDAYSHLHPPAIVFVVIVINIAVPIAFCLFCVYATRSHNTEDDEDSMIRKLLLFVGLM
eukprot:gene7500-8090_t